MQFQIPPLAHRLRNQEKIKALEEELVEVRRQQENMLQHIKELTEIIISQQTADK